MLNRVFYPLASNPGQNIFIPESLMAPTLNLHLGALEWNLSLGGPCVCEDFIDSRSSILFLIVPFPFLNCFSPLWWNLDAVSGSGARAIAMAMRTARSRRQKESYGSKCRRSVGGKSRIDRPSGAR